MTRVQKIKGIHIWIFIGIAYVTTYAFAPVVIWTLEAIVGCFTVLFLITVIIWGHLKDRKNKKI